MPDGRDDALAEAHAALLRAEGALRRHHGLYGELLGTTRVVQEHVRLRDEIIAAQERTIKALQPVAQERGRRMRPKSEKRRG
jgi:hypothetical protein